MGRKGFRLQGFVAPEDGLAAEHAAVSGWVEDAFASQQLAYWYREVDLKSLPSGQVFFNAQPQDARRYVLAALVQARYWAEQAELVRSQGKTEMERVNAHILPGWDQVQGRHRQALAVIDCLMRRALPFEEADVLAIVAWCNSIKGLSSYAAPLGSIARMLQRYAGEHALSPSLREALRQFAYSLRQAYDKGAKRLGTAVEQLCAAAQDNSDEAAAVESSPAEVRPVSRAPAGDPAVLDQLKRHLGVAAADAVAAPLEEIGPDHFPLRADSPLRAEHGLISNYFREVVGKARYAEGDLEAGAAGRRILKLDERRRGLALLAVTERWVAGLLRTQAVDYTDQGAWQSQYAAVATIAAIAKLQLALDRRGAFDFLLYLSTRAPDDHSDTEALRSQLLKQIESESRTVPLSEGDRYVLWLLRASRIAGPPLGVVDDEVRRLTNLIGDGAVFYVVPGEAWADAVNADTAAMPAPQRRAWVALLKNLLTATAARPSDKWLKSGGQLLEAVGHEQVAAALQRWLPVVNQGRTIPRVGAYHGDARGAGDTMHDENAACLRGLLWLAPLLERSDGLIRMIASVAMSAYRKVPGVGPRAVKVGNAAVYALSEMASAEAVGQLAMLKVRIKFGTAQKEIEKAFTTAAEALGLPRDQIEEMGVPTYGMEEVGLRRESFGEEFSAELRVQGRDVQIHWLRADGKPQKSVPAKVKSEHKEELKELQGAAKDIAAMLPAQAERLDSMFLLEKRSSVEAWRERYLDHPLVGTLARRLIWSFSSCGREQVGMWLEGRLVDVNDAPLDMPDDAQVQLWHPIGRPMADVLAWRRWLEGHEVRQPFKQAHREIYVLTDAERRTRTYSNRFAAHILRQYQFNALCAARGWKNKLRLLVDDTYPPASRELATWGLRAEFWIEGIGDGYGQDTSESGAFLRLSTDQVRFYRTGAAANIAHAGGGGYVANAPGPGDGGTNEPLPLEQIPPLVLSEILRDVDLFVGVASVGNDPAWQDGGAEGRYRDYWHGYSFGELSETARTRRAVLENLLPRLGKLRDRCSLDERFLLVRGDLRTYKIHLGSGNILMEPNDQYLCIVPDRSAKSGGGAGNVFLPFEGDTTLSVILSKAFLLAEDTKIKDPTITRQIRPQ